MLYKGGIWTHNTSETDGFPSAYMKSQVYNGRDKSVSYDLTT